MTTTDPRLLLLSPKDTVFVLRDQIEAGETIVVGERSYSYASRLGIGHKIARVAVAAGGKVVKYGAIIGSASTGIAPGDHVHVHNLKSDYTPTYALNMESDT